MGLQFLKNFQFNNHTYVVYWANDILAYYPPTPKFNEISTLATSLGGIVNATDQYVSFSDALTFYDIFIPKVDAIIYVGGGTTDYLGLNNKPKINSVELQGNKTLVDLGIPTASAVAILQSAVATMKHKTDVIQTSGSGDSYLANDGRYKGIDKTVSYDTEVNNKPKINNVELQGNKTLVDLGIPTASEVSTLNTELVNIQGTVFTIGNTLSNTNTNVAILQSAVATMKHKTDVIQTSGSGTKALFDSGVYETIDKTVSYDTEVNNKPKINNVELQGNKTLVDLGLASLSDMATLQSAVATLDISKQDVLVAGSDITITPTINGHEISAQVIKSYNNLNNKPKINNVELQGDQTSEDLGLASLSDMALAEQTIDIHSNEILKINSAITTLQESDVNINSAITTLQESDVNINSAITTLNLKVNDVNTAQSSILIEEEFETLQDLADWLQIPANYNRVRQGTIFIIKDMNTPNQKAKWDGNKWTFVDIEPLDANKVTYKNTNVSVALNDKISRYYFTTDLFGLNTASTNEEIIKAIGEYSDFESAYNEGSLFIVSESNVITQTTHNGGTIDIVASIPPSTLAVRIQYNTDTQQYLIADSGITNLVTNEEFTSNNTAIDEKLRVLVLNSVVLPQAQVYLSAGGGTSNGTFSVTEPATTQTFPTLVSTTPTLRNTFTYIFPQAGFISSNSTWQQMLKLQNLQPQADYTITGALILRRAGFTDFKLSEIVNYTFETGNQQTSIQLVLPFYVNYIADVTAKLEYAKNDSILLQLTWSKANGTSQTINIVSTATNPVVFLRNGGEIPASTVTYNNGTTIRTQSEINLKLETALSSVVNQNYTITDTIMALTFASSPTEIINAFGGKDKIIELSKFFMANNTTTVNARIRYSASIYDMIMPLSFHASNLATADSINIRYAIYVGNQFEFKYKNFEFDWVTNTATCSDATIGVKTSNLKTDVFNAVTNTPIYMDLKNVAYTCPSAGLISTYYILPQNNRASVHVNGTLMYSFRNENAFSIYYCNSIRVNKGDIISLVIEGAPIISYEKFFPASL